MTENGNSAENDLTEEERKGEGPGGQTPRPDELPAPATHAGVEMPLTTEPHSPAGVGGILDRPPHNWRG